MIQHHAGAAGVRPIRNCGTRKRRTAVPAPHDRNAQSEALGEERTGAGMAECVGRVQHIGRDTTGLAHRARAFEEIPHQRLAAGHQHVGQHVPRSRFQLPVAQRIAQGRPALRPHHAVVVEHDRLPVEEERQPVRRVEQIIDQSREPLPHAAKRVVPLTVPVRV